MKCSGSMHRLWTNLTNYKIHQISRFTKIESTKIEVKSRIRETQQFILQTVSEKRILLLGSLLLLLSVDKILCVGDMTFVSCVAEASETYEPTKG